MTNYIKIYWPIFFSLATVLVSLVSVWATYGIRLQNVENRQDRQSAAIMAIQTELQTQAKDSARLEAKVDAIDNNVDYIRGRIDRAVGN